MTDFKTFTKDDLLNIMEGESFYSVMLQGEVYIKDKIVTCLRDGVVIRDPSKTLVETLADEMFINTFACYPTEENIKRIFYEETGKNFDEFFKTT